MSCLPLPAEFARLTRLPPYVFAITTELKMAARRRGEDIIDFGMGNPDGPTPPHIVDKLVETVQRPDTHGYSVSKGIPRLRRAICHWYQSRYGVEFDPETEAIVTIGSKEGIAHLALATLGRGDTVLVPNPSYPIHIYGPVIAGADIRHVPMTPDVDFFAELEQTIHLRFPKPKMLIINFPSNPTAQCVELPFFEKIVALARQYGIWVVHDLAYADIAFDGWKAPSIMQVPGARDVAVEFFTMSKSYNMAGWRVGFMVGNTRPRQRAGADQGLPRLRHVHADPGGGDRRARRPAGLRAPRSPPKYQRRRDVLVQGPARGRLDGRRTRRRRCTCGRRFPSPTARAGSLEFAKRLLARGQGVGVAGHRLRRVRRRPRPLRADRERGPHPAGGARHQARCSAATASRAAEGP